MKIKNGNEKISSNGNEKISSRGIRSKVEVKCKMKKNYSKGKQIVKQKLLERKKIALIEGNLTFKNGEKIHPKDQETLI